MSHGKNFVIPVRCVRPCPATICDITQAMTTRISPSRLSVIAFVCAAVLAACETTDNTPATSFGARQPGQATYRCDSGVTLDIRNAVSTVDVVDSRGVTATLPASPPGARDRYAEGPHSLVLDGRTATWFTAGKKPVDCTR